MESVGADIGSHTIISLWKVPTIIPDAAIQSTVSKVHEDFATVQHSETTRTRSSVGSPFVAGRKYKATLTFEHIQRT